MKNVVLCLARALVNRPDRVRVDEFDDDDGTTVYELEVSPEDRGRVIGRRGRTVDAMRTIVDAIGRRQGGRYDVEILE